MEDVRDGAVESEQQPRMFQYSGKCSHCKTAFGFTGDGAEFLSAGGEENYLKAHCPVCGRHCYVKV